MAKKIKKSTPGFLGPESRKSSFNSSRFIVLPVPYEATTSYGKGTAKGPGAVIKASAHIETFDEELLSDTSLAGIHTMRPLSFDGTNAQSAQARISSAVDGIVSYRKVPVMIGGEHTITPAAVSAVRKKHPTLTVLQIDAHADLRDRYEENKLSHACAMRRVLEICPVVQAGIRNLSKEEYDFAVSSGQIKRIHFAGKTDDRTVKNILNQLSDAVYVTIDVDGLDPSIIPSTGTPEPGGLSWYQLLGILREVAGKKDIVGFDVNEFSPIEAMHAPDFAVAKLIYRLMGYIVSRA
jgi:agmatinase